MVGRGRPIVQRGLGVGERNRYQEAGVGKKTASQRGLVLQDGRPAIREGLVVERGRSDSQRGLVLGEERR